MELKRALRSTQQVAAMVLAISFGIWVMALFRFYGEFYTLRDNLSENTRLDTEYTKLIQKQLELIKADLKAKSEVPSAK
ncbi:MAG: hypothetical protein OHK0029_36700 [Armatimonadaceae bacterium]